MFHIYSYDCGSSTIQMLKQYYPPDYVNSSQTQYNTMWEKYTE